MGRSWRSVGAVIGTGALVAAAMVVPAAPAHAAVVCDVDYVSTHWSEGPGTGGFHANIDITNLSDPLTAWTLSFVLPAGQSIRQGWGAVWSGTTGELTASHAPWGALLGTGQTTTVGFLGGWSGSFADPTSFRLNGVPCEGTTPPDNQPPTVTLTSPTAGATVLAGRPLTLAADASDPDGTVERVEFFINDVMVGVADEVPFEVTAQVPSGLGQATAFARAYDDGSPPLAGGSEPVSFHVISLPPLWPVVEPTSLEVIEGGSATFDVRLDVSAATETVHFTVTGDPGVSVAPDSVALGPDDPVREVTVSAAPGSAGAVATVTASGPGLTGTAQVAVTVLGEPAGRVSNPYLGAEVYVDPDWSGRVLDQATSTPGGLGQQMATVATYPTAVWLDSIDAVTAGRGLVGHLDAALARQPASGAGSMVVQLVIYNLPERDCMHRAAPGELTVLDADRYRAEFIDPIVEILSRPEYADLRVVTVVEPHSMPSLVLTLQPWQPTTCALVPAVYRDSVRYALAELSSVDNVYPYLDFSFSGFFGYPDNASPAADLYADLVLGEGGPGPDSVTGFVANVGQYAPLREPFLPDPEQTVIGVPVYQSMFFDWNRDIHELGFAQRARDALVQRGFPARVGMLIDTSRNGWGGPDRPTQQSTATDVEAFVDESRIDRRPTRISWCNQVGAGLGARPQANPAPGIHAYAWLTPPGVSDGVADRTAPSDPDRPYLRHRDQCHPSWQAPQGRLIPGNALAGAPHYGQWFPELFAQLVGNAHPPIV